MKKIIPKLSSLIDTILCLSLVIVTLSKGGFYKEDILFPVLLINILGVILGIIKLVMNVRDNGIITKSKLVTLMDVFVSILPFAYILPLIFNKSLSIENSIFEAMRYTNVAIIYFIIRSSKNSKIYVNVLLGLACVVGVLGLDEITYRVAEDFGGIIGYLDRNNSIISSVVQYSNIAAIIMLLGVGITISKILESRSVIYKYICVFLQIQILLTCSRMGAALLLFGIIGFSIYFAYKRKLDKLIKLCISFFVALVCAGLISNLIETVNYFGAILVYIVIFAILYIPLLLKNHINTVKQKLKKYLVGNYKILIYLCIIFIALVILSCTLPSNLKIIADNEEGNIITRKTTSYNYGENELYLNIVPENEETEFFVTVYQIYEDYKPEQVLVIDSSKFTNDEYNGKFRTTEGSKFVEFVFTVKKGEIIVENVEINSKEITMSYVFLPDRLAFRLKDSFTLDLNNMFRLDYYTDALKLIKLSPIVGLGGEGFKLGYQMVQDKTYISSEVHSSPLQIAVESGIIGIASYIAINIIGLILCMKLYKNNPNINNLILIYMLVAINIMALFDLTMSFAIMTYIWGLILGIIVNVYRKDQKLGNDEYILDNKSAISMVKLVFLCISIITVGCMILYNIKIYNASMITVPEKVEETSEKYNDVLFERVVILEKKVGLDKYNINFMIELDNAYSEYINVLKSLSLSAINEDEKDYLNKEMAKYVLRQKANVDNMIECEYYSKYALSQVSSCYFNNYIRYSEVLAKNFENNEVAYSFYLGYALKLNDRILEVGPNNVVANQMYKNMLEVYSEKLSNQNKYVKSLAIEAIIQEMNQRLAEYSEL